MDVTVVMDIFSARTAVSDSENGHNESLVVMLDLIDIICFILHSQTSTHILL